MRILSIGNSFSQDAHRWLHTLAKSSGYGMETANLYIGGCSLETHWENVLGNRAQYDLEWNGNAGERKISIAEALEMGKWDVVTLQQVSHLSGMPETYEPYLTNLAEVVKKAQPEANLFFHQTWAYETDSQHACFGNYHHDQKEMYQRVQAAAAVAADRIGAQIIPVGDVIQKLRETVPEFDYGNGGLSLCRDGFHLSLDYGRYAAAAAWLHTVTGKRIEAIAFEGFDDRLLQKIAAVVNGC